MLRLFFRTILKITIVCLAALTVFACSSTAPETGSISTANVNPPPRTPPSLAVEPDTSIPPLNERMRSGLADNPTCGDPRQPVSSPRKEAAEWTVAQACIDLIKYYEGFESRPYAQGDLQLIGYGHAILPNETFSSITEVEAEDLLQRDVAERAPMLADMIEVPVTQNEFSAMVCLAYSMDVRQLARDSTMTALNNNQRRLAADQITTIRRANGQILRGLVERRQQECSLFLTP